jgi:hypothetical protein
MPVLQHESAYHIQDFIEKRRAKWSRNKEEKDLDYK